MLERSNTTLEVCRDLINGADGHDANLGSSRSSAPSVRGQLSPEASLISRESEDLARRN